MNFLFSFLPQFSAWSFLWAGVACATAPVIIHLLNRRRFRVVRWAAMPFLREALQRNRKMMQIRDIILMLLRTAAVLLFGAALARPFFSSGSATLGKAQALHAVLVIDNSLSMSYLPSPSEGSLLDKAKDRAKQFIDELPNGSVVTVVPLCGSAEAASYDPYPYKDKSLTAAIDAIHVVDRSASLQRAANEMKKAEEASRELSKRFVLFSDQQTINWRDLSTAEQMKTLPPLQVVNVGPTEWENAWISDLRVQDGLADVETPTTFIVEIDHHGGERRDVSVTLYMGDEVIGTKAITLDGRGGKREVILPYTFSTVTPAQGQPEFVPIKAVMSPDRLIADNERHLVVPVVASLPVLFIDQYSDDEEDPIQKRLGETRRLRRLLAPTSTDDMQRQLIKVKHLKLDQLQQADLEDARLVIIAGVKSPDSPAKVQLLRDYVKQGGQLVIGAGAEFDPQAWTELAWLDGGGILPLPLANAPQGNLPDEAVATLNPVVLSYESFGSHYYFNVANTSEEQLRDIFGAKSTTFFFRYVVADAGDEVVDKLKAAELERLQAELTAVAEAERGRAELAKKDVAGELDAAGRQQLHAAEEKVRTYHPAWLRWGQAVAAEELPTEEAARKRQLEALANTTLPQVRARFVSESGPPFLVERRIGRGNVMLMTSSISTSWNTLARNETIFVYDRILRSMIEATLPQRNFDALDRLTLPLASEDREAEISLVRPGREDDPEPLDVGFIGKDQLGITVNKPLTRGQYIVTAKKATPSAGAGASMEQAWKLAFSINGGSEESDLTPLAREAFDQRAAGSDVRWVGPGDSISVAGATITGQNYWKLMIFGVLVFLLIELAILAWPTVSAGAAAAPVAVTVASSSPSPPQAQQV